MDIKKEVAVIGESLSGHASARLLPRDAEFIEAALERARAAGYAEAIEKAAKVADRYRIGADEQGGIRARCIAEDIRALAPADKEKPPSCEACSNAIGGTCWAHRK